MMGPTVTTAIAMRKVCEGRSDIFTNPCREGCFYGSFVR